MSTFPAARPIIAGFHPDPSVCRVGDDYYLACSSFEYHPGVPIFHSTDLVRWTQIGNVLNRPEQLRLDGAPSSGGVYAPTLRHHDGRFWLVVTNVGVGNLLVTATDPAGPWSDPVPLPGVPGIDPDLVWDEDGVCWCTIAGVSQVRLDPETGETLGALEHIWSGTPGSKAPEAPHLYRVGGYWYLLIAEGGTERGHAVSVARGPSPSGPFEPCPANPVLTHRGTGHPVQNTGHADLVQAPDGSWWAVFLGVRPAGVSPGWHVLGRETFLAPVTWSEGWPVFGEPVSDPAEMPWPVRPAPPQSWRDDFDTPALHPRWLSLRRRDAETCTLTERPNWLTLRARGASLDDLDAVFAGHRQQHPSCGVSALIDASDGIGGLAARLDEAHHYEIEASAGHVRVLARIGPLRSEVATLAVPTGPTILGIEITPSRDFRDPRTGPDTLTFHIVDADGRTTDLATLDGKYLSTEVAGGFTGRVLGMYAASGTVRFDWFDHLPTSTPTGSRRPGQPPSASR